MTTVLVLVAVWLIAATLLLIGWHRMMSASDRRGPHPTVGAVPHPRPASDGSVSPADRPGPVPPRESTLPG